MRALFPGEARPLPAATGGRVVLFAVDDRPAPQPVRHAAGYEPFVALAEANGVDPIALASDLSAFGAFVHARRAALADPVVAEAAAVFLGNTIAVLHPRASWRTTSEPEIGTEAVSMPVRGAVAAMQEQPEFTARMTAELLRRWAEADTRHDDVEAAMAAAQAATDAARLAEVPEFIAPFRTVGPFLDEHGEPIPYGGRWGTDGPPEDTYSRVSHPERFAPLHVATEALIEHLERYYDVETVRSTGAEQTVTLRPSAGAPLRFTLTGFPAVQVRAGLLLDGTFPDCGCDACDETAESQIGPLVETVLGVVAGGFGERLLGPRGPGATSVRFADGGGRSSGGIELPEQRDRLVEPETVVALDGASWPAWPRRG